LPRITGAGLFVCIVVLSAHIVFVKRTFVGETKILSDRSKIEIDATFGIRAAAIYWDLTVPVWMTTRWGDR